MTGKDLALETQVLGPDYAKHHYKSSVILSYETWNLLVIRRQHFWIYWKQFHLYGVYQPRVC